MPYLDELFVRLYASWRSLEDDESGQTLIEYALIIGLIAIGTIAAVAFFGDTVQGMFSDAGSSVLNAG